MGVKVPTSADDYVDWGDIPGVAGIDSLTLAISWVPTGTLLTGDYLFSQINSSGSYSFYISTGPWDANEVMFIVSDGTNAWGASTAGNILTSGELTRIVARVWEVNSTPNRGRDYYVDGVAQAASGGGFNGLLSGGLQNLSDGVRLGDMVYTGDLPHTGEFFEVALWAEKLSDSACIAISSGKSPAFYRTPNSLFYSTLHDLSSIGLANLWGPERGTNTGCEVVNHIPVEYPVEYPFIKHAITVNTQLPVLDAVCVPTHGVGGGAV